MPTQITYDSLQQQLNQSDPTTLNSTNRVPSPVVTNTNQSGSAIDLPMDDFSYESSVGKKSDLDNILSLKDGDGAKLNNYDGSQLLLNSDRVIINSRTDYTMLFGQAGVAISSPEDVNIDADAAVTIYGDDGLYLGVPGKGLSLEEGGGVKKMPKTKAEATLDENYEPMVLGLKLVNLLEDLIITIKNATIITPTGKAYLREDTIYELACLQARLPEMLSTYGYIDGISHEIPDPAPEPPAQTQASSDVVVGTTAGPTSNIGSMGSQPNDTPLTGGPLEDQSDYFNANDINAD
jgi:hypothetical protein